jgi:hypothetical protein
MMVQSGATYILIRTKQAGRLIKLKHRITNTAHPRCGDWVYACAESGKRRREGIVSVARLQQAWEILLCTHGISPDVCRTMTCQCPEVKP